IENMTGNKHMFHPALNVDLLVEDKNRLALYKPNLSHFCAWPDLFFLRSSPFNLTGGDLPTARIEATKIVSVSHVHILEKAGKPEIEIHSMIQLPRKLSYSQTYHFN
ncbi:unnamed protein product, partial [Sphenostylis stenocarpa]